MNGIGENIIFYFLFSHVLKVFPCVDVASEVKQGRLTKVLSLFVPVINVIRHISNMSQGIR